MAAFAFSLPTLMRARRAEAGSGLVLVGMRDMQTSGKSVLSHSSWMPLLSLPWEGPAGFGSAVVMPGMFKNGRVDGATPSAGAGPSGESSGAGPSGESTGFAGTGPSGESTGVGWAGPSGESCGVDRAGWAGGFVGVDGTDPSGESSGAGWPSPSCGSFEVVWTCWVRGGWSDLAGSGVFF